MRAPVGAGRQEAAARPSNNTQVAPPSPPARPPPPPPRTVKTTTLALTPQHCAWHGPGNGNAVGLMQGNQETNVDPWFSHLDSTLGWELKNSSTLSNAYLFFSKHWNKFVVTTCKTRANRYWHIECKYCRQVCAASYGHSNHEFPDLHTACKAAMQSMAQFSLVDSSEPQRHQV